MLFTGVAREDETLFASFPGRRIVESARLFCSFEKDQRSNNKFNIPPRLAHSTSFFAHSRSLNNPLIWSDSSRLPEYLSTEDDAEAHLGQRCAARTRARDQWIIKLATISCGAIFRLDFAVLRDLRHLRSSASCKLVNLSLRKHTLLFLKLFIVLRLFLRARRLAPVLHEQKIKNRTAVISRSGKVQV